MPSTQSTIAEVARILRLYRFHFSSEEELQRGIAEALTESDVPFVREARLSDRCRIDFVVPVLDCTIGIEVKVAGAPSSVMRQLNSYLRHIDGIVLVTTRRKHRALGKTGAPIEVVWLSLGAL
jgi:hypothetical protein